MADDIAGEVSAEIQQNLARQNAQEIQDEITRQRQVNFQSSMTVAARFEPAKYGEALKVERQSGIPAKVAYDQAEQIQQVKQADRLNGLFNFAPRTAEALSEPSSAIVAKGDEDRLSDMERAVIAGDFHQQGFFERQIAGPLRKWWDQDTINDTPGRLVQLDRISGDFDRVDAGEAFDSPWANEYRAADEAGRKSMRDNVNLERNLSLDKVRVAQFGLNQAVVDPSDIAFQEAEGVGGVLGVLADDPLWAGRVAAQSLPDMASSLVAGLINPLFGGVAEGSTAANYKFIEVLREKGIDPADPVQLLGALRNDELLAEANERSLRYGAGIGAVSLASFGLLGRTLAPTRLGGQPLRQGTREAINVGVQVPVQGGLEALGELTGQVAERGQVSDIDSKEVALEGILGTLMAVPEAGAFAGKRFVQHQIQARRAERAGQLQRNLVNQSLDSSTRKHDPASFERIVGTQLAGQANEWVEIPAAKLQELNQSGLLNLPEVLENVGIDPAHFTAQVELGGSVRLKNSGYLAYLAEFDEQLGSSVRVTSNDYSLDDVAELDKQMVAEMERVASQFGQTDQLASAYSDVLGQLLNAGYERSAADSIARQAAAGISRIAQQSGQSVPEFLAANPLRIGRDLPEPVKRVRGDQLSLLLGRLRAGDIPQPADMFGKSLGDYLRSAGGLNDEGGELAALDIDEGRVGRNRLTKQTGGLSLDDAAMQAWERGYFPGVPREQVGPQLIVDALQQELAGTPRFSTEQENATLRDQAATLEALQAHLDELGVDLETTSDEEVLSLLRGGEQRLEQFAGPTAWTADVPALQEARARIEQGDNPNVVRQETGWFQGVDGKWRFEIDDSAATFKPLNDWLEAAEDGDGVPLGEVLEHPALFAAYPELARVMVRVDPERQAGGFFSGEPGRGFVGAFIELGDPSTYPDAHPAIDTLMHEIQHAIQAREGFATGGSPDVLRAEKDQAMADRDYWQAVVTLRRDAEANGGDYQQAAADYTATFEAQLSDQQLADAQRADSVEQLEQRVASAEAVMRTVGNPSQTYTKLAGEIEARNTERRRTLTAEERQAASPEQTADIPGEQAIVWWNGVEMVSLPVDAQADPQVRTLNQSAVTDASEIPGLDDELQALAEELLANGAQIDQRGNVTLYHRTSADSAAQIRSSGQMTGAEDGVFFSTKPTESQATGFGDSVLTFQIPLEELELDDAFGDEAHVRIPLERAGEEIDISGWLQPEQQRLEQAADGGQDARGSISFGERQAGVRQFDIRLGPQSDLSTVLHEMGHYYLEVIGDLVAAGSANEALAADYAVIRTWLGAEGDAPLTVEQHEQFARGFEKYLAEGKAPSIELQHAFARFKRWLVAVYKDLTRLNVELSPEVRGVFSRLLASEEAIAEAEEALALSERFESSLLELMDEGERANYQRASRQARDEATEAIEQELLRAEQRKAQAWYREQRQAVAREVREELAASQPYRARQYLFGNAPHPQLGKPLRLDSAAVSELFGTRSKEARFLGRARVKTGGLHPDLAASLLGYLNPVEMLTDMRAVPSLAEAVKAETERRMAERYPDPRTDGTLTDKALAAVGEREAEVQAIQLRVLARQAGRQASQHRIIKEAARQHIAKLRLRDALPNTFQRASVKAARAVEEALLAGDLRKAYEEKEKQLMNLHLFREASKAQDLAQQKRTQAKAYAKKGAKRERLQKASTENFEVVQPDGSVEYVATQAAAKQAEAAGATVTPLFNFLEQVDALLAKYEFAIPRKAIRQQRESLAQFLASLADQSLVVNPPEWLLLDRAARTNWNELTIGELVDVVDMLRQIDQLAKNKLNVLKDGQWSEFEPLRDDLVASIERNAGTARSSNFNVSFGDTIRKWGREWLGWLPADQIARELDGQDELGPVQENITTPVQVAGRNALIREKAEHQVLAELIKQFYTPEQLQGMNATSIAIPEIGDSLTRMQMVMLMANLGNEGNRQALLSEARGLWTAETIQAVMQRLEPNDADFVEALWAWIDHFWPEVAENEAKRTGVAPAKVTGDPYPVRLSDGQIRVLKGGYFPLKYDGDLSIKTSQDEVGQAFKNMTAGRTAKAYTPEGHRVERVGSGGRPVKLGFDVVLSHVSDVVRDIVMTDPVNQAWRFLHDREVQGAFERGNLKELFTALEIWLQDTAEGEKLDGSWITSLTRRLRVGFTANVMLFNIANSVLNLAGTHPLVVLGKGWAVKGYRAAFDPANWQQMYELSAFMREARVESYNKDLALVQDQLEGKPGWRNAMVTAGFYVHNKTQQFMDAVVWMGAYQKGISLDLDQDQAVTYADQRVVEASGSGVFADRSALERGTLSRQTRQSELVRGLTLLAGYMLRKMAIARRRTAETSFKDLGQALNWAVDMALLFTVEGLAFAFVKGNTPDEEDEPEDWLKSAAWETFASVGGGLPPLGRPIVSELQGFGGGTSSIDIFAGQFGDAVAQAKQGEVDTTAAKAIISLIGTATKTPGIATNRILDYIDRAGSGETPPWYELFTGNRDK